MTDSSTAPRVAFTTLGCKVNQSETDLLARQFSAAGYECVDMDGPAEVYVVNTCTVTHVADRKSRQALNQARRANPGALVVATGCYASIVGDALADDRILVIKNRDKDRIPLLVDGRLNRSVSQPPSFSDPEKYLEMAGGEARTRAMVKAQDGCDSHCTYCIIPRARGRSRSLSPNEVIRRTRGLVAEGHSEIVITGVDLGGYGQDEESYPDLGGLLRRVLRETDAPRLRVSSLEPGDFDPSWLTLWEDERMCRHLHVPLQAGSRSVLERMERTYTPEQFATMVDTCRRHMPGVTITTDVMVGFPGETDVEFEEGRRFISAMSFDGMHVFKYSRRSGTRAARMPDQVSDAVKQRRSSILREEASQGVRRLMARHVGTCASVVWEVAHGDVARGLTDTNVRAFGPPISREGSLTRVRLGTPFRDGLWAEPVGQEIPLVQIS